MHTLNFRLTADSYVMAGPDALVRHCKPTIGKPNKTATQRLRPPGLVTSYTTIASADRRLGTTPADSFATRLVTSAVTVMQSLMKSFLPVRSTLTLDPAMPEAACITLDHD
jgi:hypothetical protein